MGRIAVAVVVLLAGCGGISGTKCVTGASSACACPSGGTGAQVCRSDGTFEACVCAPGNTVDGGGGGLDASAGDRDGADGADAPGLPPTLSMKRRMAAGPTRLVGGGAFSCTNQLPASGDRWCAFVRPSALAGLSSLWVVNVSRAVAGDGVQCNGTDPSCFGLTGNLYFDPAAGYDFDGFFGDTLIYYADATSTPDTEFIGTVYAWRPGWTAGRALTSDTGVLCAAHQQADTAFCLENFDGTIPPEGTYDLLAGRLPAEGGGPLPRVASPIVVVAPEVAITKFQVNLSSDGTYVAWSARPTAAGIETLNVKKLGDLTAPQVVASDVALWSTSPDGARWYWLSAYNYDTVAPSGILQSAAFPDGTGRTMLAANVASYQGAGQKSVAVMDGYVQGAGTLKLIADRDNPTAVRTIDTGVVGVLDLVLDGAEMLYIKNLNVNNTYDLYLASPTTTIPCMLSSTAIGLTIPSFLLSGRGVAWAGYQALTGEWEGMFTNVATCTSAKFASNVFGWSPIGDEGYIFSDDSPDQVHGTLRYARSTGGGLPRGSAIQTFTEVAYAPLLPALPAVVYVVNGVDATNDGLYVSATLPFTAGR